MIWIVLFISMSLLAAVAARPALASGHGGKLFCFVAVLILPMIAAAMGLNRHVEHSKTTQFCLSCHVMEPFGRSLRIDDVMHVPASHYQNGRVPREAACFSCHTTYTMYGDVSAKLRGLRHVWVQYVGTVPSTIKLYSAYNNRECLHCHAGARSFEEATTHKSENKMEKIKLNQLSCLSSGCHDQIHDLPGLAKAKLWEPN